MHVATTIRPEQSGVTLSDPLPPSRLPLPSTTARSRPYGGFATLERTGPTRHQREDDRRRFARLGQLTPGTREHRNLREELVRRYLPLTVHFARRYAGRGEPLDDLVQAGAIGLVKAVDRFDVSRGTEFSTFAGPTIQGEIRRHFRDRTWSMHVHRSLQDLSMLVSRARVEVEQELGHVPTVAELAKRLHLSQEQIVESLECHRAYRSTSLETPVAQNLTLGDTLGAEDRSFTDIDMHEALGSVLARIPAREQRILQMRFYGNLTLAQIAVHFGISQMHVSRLLQRTLARLRTELTEIE